MVQDFDKLRSTKVGIKAEDIVEELLQEWKCRIDFRPDVRSYDNAMDFIVSKNGVSWSIEVKGDDYPTGPNIALEHKQQAMKGGMMPSGMSVTKADYIFYYVFRWNKLYIFKPETYRQYLKKGWITKNDSKVCNKNSLTGATECYVLNAGILEDKGFFSKIIDVT